jgi:hypothetical protein
MADATLTREAPAPEAPPRGPSGRTVLIVVVVTVLCVLVAAVVWSAAARYADWATSWMGRPAHTVDGARDGLTDATLDLVSGATTVTVRSADLGDTLYRVSTPDGSARVPSVVRDRALVQVHLTDSGDRGPGAVVVQLGRSVRWHLRLTAGATDDTLDLRGADLAGVEFIGGVSGIDLALPRPHGTIVVRMSGGVSRFALHVPSGVPTRVQAQAGAGSVTVDGVTRSGVGAGTIVTPAGWDAATDRYDVDNTAGVSAITVDRS